MSRLILPRRFYSQPQGRVEVDWSHPLTSGMLAVYSAGQGRGGQFSTPFGTQAGVLVSPGAQVVTPGGLALNNDYAWATLPTFTVEGYFSFFWLGRNTSLSQSTRQLIGFGSTSSNNPLAGLFTGASANKARVWVRNNNNAIKNDADSLENIFDGTLQTVAATVGYGAAKYYTRGQYAGFRTTSLGALSVTFNRVAANTLLRASSALQFAGETLLGCAWAREISAEEIAELDANPWQIFRAPKRVLYFDVGGTSGGTTHNITTANSQQSNTASAGAIAQTHLVSAANSSQAITASTGAIQQMHLVGVHGSQQINTASAASVSQSSIALVSAANSVQANTASTGAVAQTHLIGAANSQSINVGSVAAVRQTHLIGVSSSQQSNAASAGSVSQDSTTFISASNSAQSNTTSSAGISQTHLIVAAPAAVDHIASASAIVQTHLVGAASSVQSNAASAGSVTVPGASSLTPADIAAIWDHELAPGISARAALLDLMAGPSASQIADAVAQRVIESGLTMEQMLRIMLAGISGGRSGIAPGPGTVRYKSRDGSKDRIVLTHDALGNGTPTVDGS